MMRDKPPLFYVWVWRWGITVRMFRRLFQVIPIKRELFSQRHDESRIRIFGLSFKLFGD